MILNIDCGNVIIELFPEASPKSVDRFKMLISSGKYNDIAFHRVIKDVLVQSGDLEFGKKIIIIIFILEQESLVMEL